MFGLLAKATYRTFFNLAPIGMALIDGNGRVRHYNDAFKTMIKADPQGLKLVEMLQFPKDESSVEVKLGNKVLRVYRLDLKMSKEQIIYVVDETTQRTLESQIAQSQKMQAIGQLAGGVAHDFNNLLTAMIGYCDLLLQRHQPGDQSFGDIMQIKQNANRAASLTRQLLAFSRQQTLQPKVLDVTDVLTELSHLLRRLLGETIKLELKHARDLGLVKVDHGQLEQVIVNLAVNARDAMESGGTLTISTSVQSLAESYTQMEEEIPPGKYVIISVKDTGSGIPEKILKRIFDPFFSTKEVGAGTGLGLATVHGIIRQTGGYITVTTEEGKGSEFKIWLPEHQPGETTKEQQAEQPAEQPKDLTGHGTILLVEDEEAVRKFATRALEGKGYKVIEAHTGEMALKILNEDSSMRPGLIITDVVMPEMDGPTMVGTLREQGYNCPVIFISGYTEDRLKMEDTENISFLPKPFSLKLLAERVKEAFED